MHELGVSITAFAILVTSLAYVPPAAAQIEEVVVTARKRTEVLQEVPMAITAVSAEAIERRGIRALDQLVKIDPSVYYDEAFGQQDTRIGIRGLSNTIGRSQVAFLVDGIDVTTESVNSTGSGLLVNRRLLNDLERIEIVKGPQSALYGRAAFAGAINYITQTAGDQFESSVGTTIAEDGQYELRGMISSPFLDGRAGLRLNGVWWTADGFYENSVSGADVGGGDGYGLALTGNWDATDALDFKLRLSYSDDEYDQTAMAIVADDVLLDLPPEAIAQGAFTEDDQPVPAATSYGSGSDLMVALSENPLTGGEYEGNTQEVFRASLVANWATPVGTFSSYTGYTDGDSSQFWDGDRFASGRPDTSLGNFQIRWTTETEQFSQELRWASEFDGPLQLILGGLYWNEQRDQDDSSSIPLCLPFGQCPAGSGAISLQELAIGLEPVPVRPWRSETDHWSAYGVLEWQMNDAWQFTAEARVVSEDFETTLFPGGCTVIGNLATACPEPIPFDGKVDDEFVAPKFTLDWTVSDEVLMYASVAKGVKPAGISQAPGGGSDTVELENVAFEAEEMWSYELGAKSDWSGPSLGQLRLNGALFFQDYSDKQVTTNVIDPVTLTPTVRILNAAGAEVWGLEIEAIWAPPRLDGLTVSAAYTYLDTEYDDFAADPQSLAQNVALAGNCPDTETQFIPTFPGSPFFNETEVCLIDRTGNQIERAPENAVVGGVRYVAPFWVQGVDWSGEINAQYTDERFADDFNFTKFDDYWNVDANLGLMGSNWEAVVFVDNVFDDDTVRTGGRTIDFANFTTSGFRFVYTGYLPAPRVFGVRLDYRF